MRKYYYITGYRKDNGDAFDGIASCDDMGIDPDRDDEIFYYFDSERELTEAKEMGTNTVYDFVITDFKEEYA
jgi:hypothetical protein|tara:strand:+ start:652 stop:867 length:216 start_codon:yes stop_codon:yes gene_type:complete